MAGVGQKGRLRAGADVFSKSDHHLGEHGEVRLRGRPVGKHVQSGTSECVLVAVVEQMGQPEDLGTEESAGWVRVRAQRCGSRPGRLFASAGQQNGDAAPCRVVLLVSMTASEAACCDIRPVILSAGRAPRNAT